MKKFIYILLSTVFVLGLAATSFAATEFKMGGDAYVAGVWVENYDLDGTNNADDDMRWWEQRVRLKVHAVLENGIEVRTRMRISDAYWSGATQTRDGDNGWTTASTADDAQSGIYPDYAYLYVPLMDKKVEIIAGHMMADWGLKFVAWAAEVDRLVIKYVPSQSVNAGIFIRKDNESFQDTGLFTFDELGGTAGDTDTFAAFVNAKTDTITTGLLMTYTKNFTPDVEKDGIVTTAYFTAKAGSVTLLTEWAWKGGELFSQNKVGDGWNDQFGGFIAAVMDFKPVTVTAAFAMASNYFVADDDFTPTFLFGTKDNYLAVMDFQSLDEDRTTWALVLGGDFQATDDLSFGAKIAYATMGVTNGDLAGSAWLGSNANVGKDLDDESSSFDIFEIDLKSVYQIAKSTKYTIGAAWGIPLQVPEHLVVHASEGREDDELYGFFQELSVEF